MQQQGAGGGAPPAHPNQGQQQAQAAVAAAASAQQMAAAASAQQAAALAAMLPAAAAAGVRPAALALHPALAAMNPGLAAAGMLPMAGPGGTFTFAARPGMQQSFFYPAVAQPVAAVGRSPSAAVAATGAAARRPSSRPGGRSLSTSTASKKHCNCKNSRCLKLYCECFASGRYCNGCNCINCYNNREHETTRQAAVEAILERNPNAFRPKIAGGPDNRRSGGARHNKGCNCKKSGCLKKYCECFQAGIVCSEICKCLDCKNYDGSEARDALVSPQSDRHGSPPGLRRTTRTVSPAAAAAAAPGMQAGFLSPDASVAAAAAGAGGLRSLAQLQQAQAAAAVQATSAAQVSAQPKPLTAEQKQQVAQEAVREVVKPEVVEKLAMLLMVVSQEEFDRRQRLRLLLPLDDKQHDVEAQQQQPGGETSAMDVDAQQQQQQAEADAAGQQHEQDNGQQEEEPAADAKVKLESMDVDEAAAAPVAEQQQGGTGKSSLLRAAYGVTENGTAGTGEEDEQQQEEQDLYETQERLVLAEFRDALQMISRVVGEKVEKKVQQVQQLLLPAQSPGSAGMVGMALPPQFKPGQAAQPGLFMAAGTPGQQLVLLPQAAVMAQRLTAASQQLGMAVTLQHAPQDLQAIYKAFEQPRAAAAAASPAVPAAVQQQQQTQTPSDEETENSAQ